MIKFEDLSSFNFWLFIDDEQKEMLHQTFLLLEREEKNPTYGFIDYSYVVFPVARAYEGFLKKLFLTLGLIESSDFNSDNFRIGRSLNPNLPVRYRGQDWVYGGLGRSCSEALPGVLWNTWKEARNSVFHWFPGRRSFIDLKEARRLVEMVVDSMKRAFLECAI